jgi:hypothetical protein
VANLATPLSPGSRRLGPYLSLIIRDVRQPETSVLMPESDKS